MQLRHYIFVAIELTNGDPCNPEVYKSLSFSGSRYLSSVYDGTNPPISDSALEAAWYRVGNEDIPNSIPKSRNRCGTSFPIYMQGTFSKNNCTYPFMLLQGNTHQVDNRNSCTYILVKTSNHFMYLNVMLFLDLCNCNTSSFITLNLFRF